MKAKYYIGIVTYLLISAFSVRAQSVEFASVRHSEGTAIIVNNYQTDYDYYYSSRISRFHRSYSTFTYYAPVFTETYWYNYQPNSWGISIYDGGGFGIGFSSGYPAYAYDYGYYGGWSEPYFSNSFYWGYSPAYYNYWYSPAVVNVRIGNSWPAPNYGHNGYGDHHNHNNNFYRPVRTSSNYYSSGNKSNNSAGNVSRRSTSASDNNSSGGETRRYQSPSKDRRVRDDGNSGEIVDNNDGSNNGNGGKAGAGKGTNVNTNPVTRSRTQYENSGR
ncbi:MAG: hypothetical protein IPN68_02475 [Bacteroidetes bacterium]|nr:hypothetical protein [Bacteroidota bacterium]